MLKNLKYFPLLLLLAMMLTIPASAEQGVGTNPYVAQLLTSGLNVGSLAPGQDYWYSYSQNDLGPNEIQSIILSLVFKPGDSRTARQVTFDVYTFDQVSAFLEKQKSKATVTGTGQLIAADYDNDTGERLWAGTVAPGEIYYVHIQNKSGLTVDYRLTAVPQQNYLPTAQSLSSDLTAANRATTPSVAQPAAAGSANFNNLPPASGELPNDQYMMAAMAIQNMSPDQAAAWLQNAAEMGWLGEATAPTAPVEPALPDADAPAVPAPPEAIETDPNIYPSEPLTLFDTNKNALAPQAEHWFSFVKADLDENLFEEMALTLFVTPGDGNITNKVNFELFTGDQYPIWLRGTPEQMTNFGAGEIVNRDEDPNTGERLWRGYVVDGDKYYIKVRNDSSEWVDYYLLVGDVENAELGDMVPSVTLPRSVRPVGLVEEVAIPVQRVVEEPGSSITAPFTAATGSNRGRLQPDEDNWYTFRFDNFEQEEPEFRRHVMFLKISPGQGYISNHVDMQIYTYPQLDLWLRGDGDEMTPMGVSSKQRYDEDTGTQYYEWEGSFVSGNTYFLRVRNDSDAHIFYDLDIQTRR